MFDYEPRFKPHFFGGYTLCLLLSGFFSGLAFSSIWFISLLAIPLYIGSLYFYAKNKNEFVKNGN